MTAAHSEGVVYEQYLPVAWETLSAPLCDIELQRTNRANEELLGTLLVLDEAPAEAEDDASREHWQRLDIKLNLILSLLGEVLAGQIDLPEAVPVSLGVERISIRAATAAACPPVGSLLGIRLYLQCRFPRALVLTGYVDSVTEAGEFVMRPNSLSENLQDLLSKFVFRQHRRAIAQARSTPKGPTKTTS